MSPPEADLSTLPLPSPSEPVNLNHQQRMELSRQQRVQRLQRAQAEVDAAKNELSEDELDDLDEVDENPGAVALLRREKDAEIDKRQKQIEREQKKLEKADSDSDSDSEPTAITAPRRGRPPANSTPNSTPTTPPASTDVNGVGKGGRRTQTTGSTGPSSTPAPDANQTTPEPPGTQHPETAPHTPTALENKVAGDTDESHNSSPETGIGFIPQDESAAAIEGEDEDENEEDVNE